MSITFVASPGAVAGGKSITSGTTFTIVLNSNAGDLVVVAIAMASATGAVSGITDTGGNTYHQVGSIVSGTLTVALWKTDKVNAAASGTLTVTVGATGYRCEGIAASYDGVAYAGATGTTASGSTGTGSSGAITLNETNSWAISAIGVAANNAMTAQNGSLRLNNGQTGARVGLVDSNDAASPVTNSVTFTAASWGVVSLELRLLEVTQLESMNNWNDGLNQINLQFAEDLPMSIGTTDILKTSIGMVVSGEQLGMAVGTKDAVTAQLLSTLSVAVTGEQLGMAIGTQDNVAKLLTLTLFLTLADNNSPGGILNLKDQPSPTVSLKYNVALICPEMGLTYNDDFQFVDTQSAAYALLSDQGEWLNAQPGNSYQIYDEFDFVLSPSLIVISDQFYWGNLWLDAFAYNLGVVSGGALTETFSDTETLTDVLRLGYADIITDQLIPADALLLGYADIITDTLVMSDVVTLGYGDQISDTITLTGTVTLAFDGFLTPDQLVLTDAIVVNLVTAGLTETLSDTVVLTDQLSLGYADLITDQLVQLDALRIGYGFQISDQLVMSDALVQALSSTVITETFFDTLFGAMDHFIQPDNSMPGSQWGAADAIDIGHIAGNVWGANGTVPAVIRYIAETFTVDQFSQALLVDKTSSHYIVLVRCSAVAETAYGAGVTVTGPSASPFYQIIMMLAGVHSALATSSTIPQVNDVIRCEVAGSTITFWLNGSLLLTANDSTIATGQPGLHVAPLAANDPHPFTNWWGGSLVRDALGVGYGDAITDSLTLSEAVLLGYADIITDTLTLSEAVASTYGMLPTDTLVLSEAVRLGYADIISDALVPTDALAVGYGNVLTDTLIPADALLLGYGDLIADQLVLTDAVGAGYGFLISDTEGANWLDAFVYSTGAAQLTETLSDTVVLSDALLLGYADLITDQMTLTGTVTFAFDGLISPDQLVMTDAFSYSLVASGLSEALSDQIVLNESLAIGYGDAVTDSLTLSEAVLLGYADIITDSLTLTEAVRIGYADIITDQLTQTDVLLVGYGDLITDSLTLSDSVLAGYGLLIADTITLTDSFAYNAGAALQTEVLSDTIVFSEAVLLGYADIIADQLVLSESVLIGYADLITDAQTLTDAARLGYGDVIAEQMVLSEAVVLFETMSATFSESLTIADAPALGYGFLIAEQQTLTDATAFGFGWADTLVLSEAVLIGWADLITDTITFSDQLSYNMSGGGVEQFTDTMTMSDAFAWFTPNVLYTDTMTLSDAAALGYGNILTDTMVLTDAYSAVFSLVELLTDTMSLSEALRVGYGSQITDTLTLTDSAALLFTMSSAFAETLSISDQTNLGYGFLISDQLVMSDAFSYSAGQPQLQEALSDTMTLSEFVSIFVSLELPADTMTLSDAMALGYGNLVADQLIFTDAFAYSTAQPSITETLSDTMTLTDALLSGFGLLPAEALSLTDQTLLGYGFLISDQLTLTDNFASSLVTASLSELLADALVMTDALGLGYGEGNVDQITLIDSLDTIGYGDAITDAQTLTDALASGFGDLVSDTITFTDALSGIGYGDLIADTLPLADAMVFNLASGAAQAYFDTLSMSEAVILGVGFSVTENVYNVIDTLFYSYAKNPVLGGADRLVTGDNLVVYLKDSYSSILGVAEVLSDALTLTDSLDAIGYGNRVTDTMTLSEAVAWTWTDFITDTLTQTDALNLGYGLAPSDSLTLTDSISFFSAYLAALSDSLTITEQPYLGYGDLVSDTAAFWLDSVQVSAGQPSIALNLSDQLAISEQIGAGYGSAISEQAAMNDQTAFVEAMLEQLADANPAQLDALATLFNYGLSLQDAGLLQEQLALLYGLITGDSLALADQLSPALQSVLAIALADSDFANWLDAILATMVFAPGEIIMASLVVLAELIAGLQVISQGTAAGLAVNNQVQGSGNVGGEISAQSVTVEPEA
jgi:hypothetical protein